MSGGFAYILDENQLFDTHCNLDMVDLECVDQPEDIAELKSLIEKHAACTGSPKAKAILEDLLEKYAEHGVTEFNIPEALKVPPISERGNVSEIIGLFGTADILRQAVTELQAELYAA